YYVLLRLNRRLQTESTAPKPLPFLPAASADLRTRLCRRARRRRERQAPVAGGHLPHPRGGRPGRHRGCPDHLGAATARRRPCGRRHRDHPRRRLGRRPAPVLGGVSCGRWRTPATPVVSAIGHEQDAPLLDLVADVRASTSTDAARRVVPDVEFELEAVAAARRRIAEAVTGRLAAEQAGLDQLRSRPRSATSSRSWRPTNEWSTSSSGGAAARWAVGSSTRTPSSPTPGPGSGPVPAGNARPWLRPGPDRGRRRRPEHLPLRTRHCWYASRRAASPPPPMENHEHTGRRRHHRAHHGIRGRARRADRGRQAAGGRWPHPRALDRALGAW
ncbi:MAG: hypothetical protein MZV63_12130, partial [Marinilabiliales bacterium]|nr:hypothetical protein [Marinilabiliales bacterium]